MNQEEAKNILLVRKKEAETELSRINIDAKVQLQAAGKEESTSQHFADGNTDRCRDENVEVIERRRAYLRQKITAINQALERIENNTYGICPKCDELISETRLLLVPEALLCISCANLHHSAKKNNRLFANP